MKKKTSKLSWFGTGAFAIIGVVYIMPILIVLINSFKTLEEAGKNFFALPSKLNLENYIELFTNSNYWIFLKNSFKKQRAHLEIVLDENAKKR